MTTIRIGVRMPNKTLKLLGLEDVNEDKNIANIKAEVSTLISLPQNKLEFVYCGTYLDDDTKTLQEYGFESGDMVNVYYKMPKNNIDNSAVITSRELGDACLNYRIALRELSDAGIPKTLRPEMIKAIVEKYPEFYQDLTAYTFLRDAVLLSTLTDIEMANEIVKEHPILFYIHISEFVLQTVREYVEIHKKSQSTNITADDDSTSETSGSESDATTASSPDRANEIRQISRNQLSQALMLAGSGSTNSLSNIAQRGSQSRPANPSLAPSTSSTLNNPSTSAATGSSTSITNSLLANALSQAMLANSDRSETVPQPAQSQPAQSQPAQSQPTQNQPPSNEPNSMASDALRYAQELGTMREMGLMDNMINVQALVVSNGDVEAAINLVLSGFGNSN